MIINDYLKNVWRPSNSGILRISFWTIASTAIVHLNTFTTLLKTDNEWLEFKNLFYLSLFMLFSICVLNVIRYTIAFSMFWVKYFLESKVLKFSLENNHYEKEGISSRNLLLSSMRTNNSVVYKYYESFKEEEKETDKRNEFACYLFLIIGVNLLCEGEFYNLLLSIEDDKSYLKLLVLPLFVIFSILAYHSVYRKEKMHLYGMKDFFKDKA